MTARPAPEVRADGGIGTLEGQLRAYDRREWAMLSATASAPPEGR
ncbi:hypothetical protein [Streptomyces luteireticuli]